ncbi:MAG: iron-sulfur cluster assembly scaffold protein [Pirellulaceae bacterium]
MTDNSSSDRAGDDNTAAPSAEYRFDERILDHYQDPFNRQPVEHATHAAEDTNRLCGDSIRVELRIDADGTVAEAGFDGEGCVISQAAASMLMEHVSDRTVSELDAFSPEDMLKLFGANLAANRQKCCLLAWRILQTARQTPLTSDDDETGGPNFGGPSLSEEC